MCPRLPERASRPCTTSVPSLMRTSPPTLVRGYLRKGQSMVARLSEARPVTTGASSEPVTLREFKSRREKAVSQG